jgi:uncharacterized protein
MGQEKPQQSTSSREASVFEPTAAGERISSVDILRGFAVLGILLINITSFGFPSNGEKDLSSAASIANPNLAAWLITSVLFEGKMRATFSMLFGAGIVLFTTRAEARQDGSASMELYYRRLLWLLAFGFLHAAFLWNGDVLYEYAVGGALLYPFRKLQPRILLSAGSLLLLIGAVQRVPSQWEIEEKRKAAVEANAAQAAGATLSDKQRDAQEEWTSQMRSLKPNDTQIAKEITDHQQGYWSVFLLRQRDGSEGGAFSSSWDTASMMLLGMGLLKLGVFSAARSRHFYWALMIVGYCAGLMINGYTAYRTIQSNFEPINLWWNVASYDLGRLAMALGHIALLVLIFQAGRLRWLTTRLAAVGQMALTNYLMQSLICTTLFYGYGAGLYGKLERYQLYSVVLGVWMVQLLLSPIWLRYFRFGPMEWLWRSLTYKAWQPLRVTVRLAQPTRASLPGALSHPATSL